MEHVLLKMARQLDALDEASLMAMWDKHSAIAVRFEPSKRWEESVLVLSLIQAKRWKNQLFNYQWAARSRPDAPLPRLNFTLESPHEEGECNRPKAKVLAFRPRTEGAGGTGETAANPANGHENEHKNGHSTGAHPDRTEPGAPNPGAPDKD